MAKSRCPPNPSFPILRCPIESRCCGSSEHRRGNRMTPTRLHRPFLIIGAALALLVACGNKADQTVTPPSSASPGTNVPATAAPTTTEAPVPVFPLRGIPMDDPVKAQRPALVVKIDNVDEFS